MNFNSPFDKKITAVPIARTEDLAQVRRTMRRRGNGGTVLFQGPDADPDDPVVAKAIDEFSPEAVVAWRQPGYYVGVKWRSRPH